MKAKAKKEIIITGILILVLVFVGINTVSEIKKKKGNAPARSRAAAVSKQTATSKTALRTGKKDFAEVEKEKESLARLEQESQSLKLKRDAFVHGPAASEEEITPSDLTLYGIIWDKDNPIAIINEIIVKVGDKIGTSTVKNIEQNCVTLNDGNRDYKLNLNP